VAGIVSPIDHPRAGVVSRDRHSALLPFDVKGKAEKAKLALCRGAPNRATPRKARRRRIKHDAASVKMTDHTTRRPALSIATCSAASNEYAFAA
jgi:hypothetical protein